MAYAFLSKTFDLYAIIWFQMIAQSFILFAEI